MPVLTAIWSFAKGIPSKVWGFICSAVAVLVLLWAVFQTGKKQAKTEAKVEDLKKDNKVLNETVKAIQDDQKKVAEIEDEVNALPSAELSIRADKWVRD